MRTRWHTIVAALAILATQIASCDTVNLPTASPGSDSAGVLDPSEDDGSNDAGDDAMLSVDDGKTEAGDAALTAEDRAVQAAVEAAEALAKSVAAILPTKDLQAIFEFGMPPPACPTLGTETKANDMLLTLDYGMGCGPMVSPSSVFKGVADGIAYIAFNAFEFEFVGVAVDGDALAGTVAGSFLLSAGGATFSVNVDLVVGGDDRVTGVASVGIDDDAGVVTVAEAKLNVTTGKGDMFRVVFGDVTLNPAGTGTFVPEAGLATVELRSGEPRLSGTEVKVEFTPQSPIDGTVTLLSTP